MMKYFAVLILLSVASAHAGNDWFEKGNGGFALVCGDKAQSYDLFEGSQKLTLDREHLTTVEDRLEYLITKLVRLNPRRAELYRIWASQFKADSEFKTGGEFNPIPDVGFGYIPNGCKLRPVIFQRDPSLLNSHRYTIDSEIWNKLAIEDQAALILHELIYRELATPPNYQMTSESSRSLNAWINSNEFNSVSIHDYLLMLQNLNVINAQVDNFDIFLKVKNPVNDYWEDLPLKFDDNGYIMLITLAATGFSWGHLLITPDCGNDTLSRPHSMGVASFDDNGHLIAVSAFQSAAVQSCMGYLWMSTNFTVRATNWLFNQATLLTTASGSYGANEDENILFDKDISFNAMKGFPVDVQISFDNQQNPRSLVFKGRACFSEPASAVNVWKESPMDPTTTWDLTDPTAIAKTLPACH